MTLGIVVAVVGCLSFAAAAVLQARGADRISRHRKTREERSRAKGGHPSLRSTVATMTTGTFMIGFVFDCIGFVCTIASARLIPLFLSQTIISARLVATALLAWVVLGLTLCWRDWIAGAVVVGSLVLLAVAAGHEGTAHDMWLHWAVLIAGPALTVLGLFLMRVRMLHRWVAVITGLIAGLVFGVMAVGSRVLDGIAPLQPLTLGADPALYAIILSGIGGFYLFTVALQTGSVNGSAAALVVGQTVLPGVIGIVALGDYTRDGWGPAAIVAFVASVVGGVLMASSGAVTAVETADANARGRYRHPEPRAH